VCRVVHDIELLPLVIVAVLALVVPFVLQRVRLFRIPVPVGEILAGMAVGTSGLDLVHMDAALTLLTFLGLVALMFISGLEVDLSAMRGSRTAGGPWHRQLSHPLLLGSAFYALTLAGAWVFGRLLEAQGYVASGLLLALIISTAALTMILPVLKGSGWLQTPLGQILLVAGAIGDFASMLAITVAVNLYGTGASPGRLLVLGLIPVLLLLAHRLRTWLHKVRLLQDPRRHGADRCAGGLRGHPCLRRAGRGPRCGGGTGRLPRRRARFPGGGSGTRGADPQAGCTRLRFSNPHVLFRSRDYFRLSRAPI
jgi:Kef-type K+ transport system membrane component KefB